MLPCKYSLMLIHYRFFLNYLVFLDCLERLES